MKRFNVLLTSYEASAYTFIVATQPYIIQYTYEADNLSCLISHLSSTVPAETLIMQSPSPHEFSTNVTRAAFGMVEGAAPRR